MAKGYMVAVDLRAMNKPNALSGAEEQLDPEDMLVLDGLKDLSNRKGLLNQLNKWGQTKIFLIITSND